jgi:8-oxo-dGTP pyrophosphatase MutT (NUDIX family)
MSKQVVAAVCYRIKNGKVEFLLVRTKDGKRRTFPKGHVKRRSPEPPWCAAAREASEEAGVSGLIEKEPFAFYTYSKVENAKEDLVAAYLLSVKSEYEPDEPERAPQWFTPEQAMKKLAKGREKKYVREHKRLVQEAMARLK